MSERIMTLPGVYRPRSDTRLLRQAFATTVSSQPSAWLDVCSGTGALAVAAARDRSRAVTAVDISRRAVQNIRLNAAVNRRVIRALRGDLFDPVADERFDVIISNPPYVPAPEGTRSHGLARAWDGGPDGRSVLDRICRQAPALLRDGGVLLLVQSSLADPGRSRELLVAAGLSVETIARHVGPLGPVACARVDYLRESGALRSNACEELLVLRGRRG